MLLGTTLSGRDVFFGTRESLVAQDQDSAGDVYDARVGGGFPPPPPSTVECEGDACSTPPSAPVDVTPSSFTFAGAGNIVQPPPVKPAVKSTKPKPKRKTRKKAKVRSTGRSRRRRGLPGDLATAGGASDHGQATAALARACFVVGICISARGRAGEAQRGAVRDRARELSCDAIDIAGWGHEDLTTTFDFAHTSAEKTFNDVKTTIVNLPAGFTANNTAVPACTPGSCSGSANRLALGRCVRRRARSGRSRWS